MLFESLFSALSAADALAASLLGAGNLCRVYPGKARPGVELPYVVMTGVSDDNTPTHDSASGLTLAEVQFSIVAETYSEAARVRTAIRGDLNAARVLANGEQPVDFSETDGFSESTDQHLLILTASIWHVPALTVG